MRYLNILAIIIIAITLYSCQTESFEGEYRSEDGSFLKLKSRDKFEFGIKKYPELFTGIYKSVSNSVEIIFRYPFFGRDAITTLSMSITNRKTVRIYRINLDADNLKIKIDVQENRAYITIDEEETIVPLTSSQAEDRLGIFYKLIHLKFEKFEK